MWANKLELKRKLLSMKLSEGGFVQEHVKLMTELCNKLSAIGEPVSEEDHVIFLLASLPGDGYRRQATGRGNVILKMNLPVEKVETRTLHNILLVPNLTYNLLSITAASKRGKVTTFTEKGCKIRDSKSKLVASGHREGGLYYLD